MGNSFACALFACILLLGATPGGETATLAVPDTWSRQDFGAKASPSLIAMWLDRTKAGAQFIPRIFLMGEAEPDTSLNDVVREALRTFESSGDTVRVSKPQRLCNGRPGWYFAYSQQGAESPLAAEQTILVANGVVYKATYVRAAGDAEDPDARRALSTLCVTQP
jgi:hypothetical protein